MRNSRLLSISVIVLIVCHAALAGAKQSHATYPALYEGGSLHLKQNHRVMAVMADNKVVFMQHGRTVSIPIPSITEISYATDVHRRFGASLLGLVPRMDLDKAEAHYVALTWTDDSPAGTHQARQEVVFRLKAGEYRNFVATLERLTGRQAVDTQRTPAVVHYDL